MRDNYPLTDLYAHKEPCEHAKALDIISYMLLDIHAICHNAVNDPIVGGEYEAGYYEGQADLADNIIDTIKQYGKN